MRLSSVDVRHSILGLFWVAAIVLLPTVCAILQNVALHKVASQPSVYEELGESFDADKAVDGNTDQSFPGGSCAHTVQMYQPSWEVDLGGFYYIDHIKIYKRLDFLPERTSNVAIDVSVDDTSFTEVCYHPGEVPDEYTCYPGLTEPVRWVSITIDLQEIVPLQICEVEVYSGLKIGKEVSKRFAHTPSVKGTGPVLETTNVTSDMACTNICSLSIMCVSVNVINSTGRECQLLGSSLTTQTDDETITFYQLTTWSPKV